jgi:hypothetical protein
MLSRDGRRCIKVGLAGSVSAAGHFFGDAAAGHLAWLRSLREKLRDLTGPA